MAGQKKNKSRSDIPYALRLQMAKVAQVRDHRYDAARVALKVALVALNDTEGLGYVRLCRFSKRLQELVAEFYEDREVQEVHLDERLKSMGFDIRDGRVFSLEDQDGNFVKKKKEVGADG